MTTSERDTVQRSETGHGGRSRAGRATPWLVLLATALAGIMDGIDVSALTVANPIIAQDLGASLPVLEALTIGYMLAMAMALIPAGSFADRIGNRRIFLIGLAGFSVSSLLVGVAGSAELMVIWRVAQGVAGAMLAASGMALLRQVFSAERLKIAIGLSISGLSLATLIGPLFGGFLAQYVHWRAIFLINLPVGALVFGLAWFAVPRARTAQRRHPRFDVAGTALLTLTVFSLIAGITVAQVAGWWHPLPPALLAASTLSLITFIRWERRFAAPLLPPGLFRARRMIVALAMIMAAGVAHFGTVYYFAIQLQQVRGFTPVQAGAGLLPLVGLVAVSAPLSGVLNRRWGARLPITLGLGMLGTGLLGLAIIGVDADFAVLVGFLLLMGFGIGLSQPSAVEVAISTAPAELAGTAAGLQQTALMISGTLGTAIFGAIIAGHAPGFVGHAVATRPGEYVSGLNSALAAGAALTLLAALIAAIALRRRTASTT